MTKKFFLILFSLLITLVVYSEEKFNCDDIKKIVHNSKEDEIKDYFKKNENKKIEGSGWVLSIKEYDSTKDIVYVDIDRPNKNYKLNSPDIFFYMDKKIAKRLSEYQLIFFIASIKEFDFSNKLVEISDVFLRGIMKWNK